MRPSRRLAVSLARCTTRHSSGSPPRRVLTRTTNIESIIMANTPPVPPAGRAPQGSKSASGKTNPKDAKANNHAGNGKHVGVSKATQSNRNSGSR